MQNRLWIFLIIGVLLLGGVLVMSNNKSQVKTGSEKQIQQETEDEKEDEAPGTEDVEDKDENEIDDKEVSKITVMDAGFEPDSVTVKVGSKVKWINKTAATANVSSAQHPTHEVYPPLNLGDFEPGKSVSLIFNEAGTYKYHDHLNPTKFGTVIVE